MKHTRRIIIALVTLSAPCLFGESITESFPYFGKIEMKKVSDGTYETSVSDKNFGPFSLTKGKAVKEGEEATITYEKVTGLGLEFTVTFDKQTAALQQALRGKRVLVGKITPSQGDTISIGGVNLEKAQIALNEPKQQLHLEGEFTQFGITFVAGFMASTKSKAVRISVEVKATPDEWKPFEAISGAPDFLKDIAITEIGTGVKGGVKMTSDGKIESTKDDESKNLQLYGAFFVTGTATNIPLIQSPLKARIEAGMADDQPSISAILSLPEGWKLSNLFP